MTAVATATEFIRKFAEYQRRVQREPSEIRNHEKVAGDFVSPDDYERVQASWRPRAAPIARASCPST